MAFGRRQFLALGFGGVAATILGVSAGSSSAAEGNQIWRVSSDWGYAVGPKARTRCKCAACRGHAANLLFSTRADAIAGRIHPCCLCQPYSIDVTAAGYESIFPLGVTRTDLRRPGVPALLAAAVASSPPATTVPPSSTVPATTVPPSSTDAPPPTSTLAPPTAAGSEEPDGPSSESRTTAGTLAASNPSATRLPVTGSNASVPIVGAIMVTVGVIALGASGRSTPNAAPTSPNDDDPRT